MHGIKVKITPCNYLEETNLNITAEHIFCFPKAIFGTDCIRNEHYSASSVRVTTLC
jgi:hypothetical protein